MVSTMTKKPRLLFNNEFSLLSTGFSNIGYEVIKRLYATNKYEIAELASYAYPDDPLLDDVPWKVYPVMPHASDIEGIKACKSVRTAQFGELKFNETLLDFHPDIVISWRDVWMDSYISHNPFRDKYKWIYMTTIDGEPQREDWIDVYKRADVLCTYTKWAANIARKQGINVIDVLSPGTDETVYKPIKNKKEYKESMGLNPDWFIIQTVMRNQGRKLYPELFKAFSLFLEKCRKLGETELANRTYLHIHCSLKDVGWNIVEEIQKYHLSNKVLLTYLDHNSKQADFGLYRGYTAWSRSSNLKSCTTTNTAVGVTREQLAELMQCADLYIQYSVCEGFGMPMIDAKACGVPIMGIPYSATAELVTEPGGIPLKIGAMFQETADQTSQRRVLPDNEYTANKIFEFFKATQMERNEIGNAARQCVLDNYTWDICAKKWESVIDSVDISDLPGWDSQPSPFRPDINNIPWQMPNQIFVEWAYDNIVGRPWLLHFPLKQSLVTALDNGFKEIPNGMMLQRTPYDKKMLVQELLHVCEEMNKLDYQRFHTVNKTQNNNDNITYARM